MLIKNNSFVSLDPQTNEPLVNFEWDSNGARLFEQITARLVGRPLGIFLDDQLVSAPIVQSVIRERGVITGLTLQEGRVLAIQLNSGTFPVSLHVVSRRELPQE